MAGKYLLLHDVEFLGRSGDLVNAKPGFARNYLLPRKFATIADRATLRLREKLQKERIARASADLAASQEIAQKLQALQLVTEVKIDHEGHMYGSVGSSDIISLLQNNDITIDRHSLLAFKPLKSTGMHTVKVKLKEGVIATVQLNILAEGHADKAETTDEATPETLAD